MRPSKLTATALVTRNSLSYIGHVFELNAARQPFVNVPDMASANALTGIEIDRVIVPNEVTGWFSGHHPLIRDDRPAQVTYTSGTEGKPKGIVLTYSNQADAAERIIDQMKLTSGVREYVGIPVTYSFGIGRIRAISAVGGRCYLPPRGFDVLELSRMLEAGEVNSFSAVPTLLRIVLQAAAVIGESGKYLRWMEIGSQYMTGAEKRALRELFPNARIIQHYGLTEASRTTFLPVSEVSDELLESVGKAVGATQVAISAEGRIQIRGPHVARWRVDSDELLNLCDTDGWLRTSDLGRIVDGYLYYDGRADDLINSGGVKINPDRLEARINELLGQSAKVVVTKVPDALRGEGVLVVAESADFGIDRLQSASAAALKGLGLYVGDALHVRVMPVIPRTATGKPLRRQLTEEFVEANSPDMEKAVDEVVATRADSVQTFFGQFFAGQSISSDDSFETLGGDSLTYIQFSLGFEDRFGSLPSGWESLTVAELERRIAAQLEQGTTAEVGWNWRRLEAATLTRASCMVCIVALHLETFVYSTNWGAAYFLFMLCGYSVMRFQWPEISRTGNIGTLLWTALRVAIPTLLVTIAMQIWARTLEIKPLLLISNWFDAREYHVAFYYFAEIYMQLMLVLAVLFSVPAARDQLRKRPMIFSATLIVLSMILSGLVEQIWDTSYLYHRTPIWYLWTIGAGMLMASARDLQGRAAAMAIVTVAVLQHHGLTSAAGYILGASAMLLFWSEITVPALLKTVVAEIAGSSMFMYLSHFQVKSLVIRLFHGPMPWVALFLAIGSGIIFSRVYNLVEGKVRGFARTRSHRATSAASTT